VRRAARVLARATSTRQAASSFETVLEDIRSSAKSARSPVRRAALEHMPRTANYFGAKIFTWYDEPDLPPTDNAHEHVFGRLSRHERIITAHKSTARRTARDGAFLISAIEQARSHLPTVEELASVPERVRRENLQAMANARHRFAQPRKIRRNLPALLEELRRACRVLAGANPTPRARAKRILRR